MPNKPQSVNIAELRRQEALEQGPFPFVIRVHCSVPLAYNWLASVVQAWVKEMERAPALVHKDHMSQLHAAIGPVVFCHGTLRHIQPAVGITLYGTVPWEREVSEKRLNILARILCNLCKQNLVEILYNGRVIVGRRM